VGRLDGDRLAVAVVAQWEGPELLGWARVATFLAASRGSVCEAIIAAPAVGVRMRRLAAQATESAPPLRLLGIPALAPSADEPFVQEVFPARSHPRPRVSPASTLLERLMRVLEGAAAITGIGEVRPASEGFVFYLRGVLVLQLESDGEGVVATFVEPEKRQVRIVEPNFARWGKDLHEQVLRLAQDPRLSDRPQVARGAAVEEIAARAEVRVTARWLPWNREGTDPIEWVGVDSSGRPVLGLIRQSVGLSDVPALCSALAQLSEAGDLWTPGADGPARVLLSAAALDPRVAVALSAFDVDVDRVGEGVDESPTASRESGDRERRGRRRTRRRRRPRAEPATEATAEEPSEEPTYPETQEEEEEPPESFEEEAGEEAGWNDVATGDFAEAEPSSGVEEVLEPEIAPVLEVQDSVEELEVDLEDETLAPVEPSAAEEADEVELEREAPRPRRTRAAIVVRDESDSILAALVLARERRHIVQFWVCRQEELMDFFRTGATDLSENVDVLLVGFTAQPVPKEVLQTVELYRGRIQWFDHHTWPIEDQELLREAIGREAIVLTEGAATPLAAVMGTAERRSRFTDKLIDFSSRRLSQNDMQKWGYRLFGLLQRLAETTGDHRQEIVPILAGKPASLPAAEDVCAEEIAWLERQDPRVVHFGEYQMVVVQVPEQLDAGEIARLARLQTGCRLSLANREGDETVLLTANEEKRHINVQGLAEYLTGRLPWAEFRPGGDRGARLVLDDLPRHPERLELLISAIADHKSVLQG
jgi:hypothetical protein